MIRAQFSEMDLGFYLCDEHGLIPAICVDIIKSELLEKACVIVVALRQLVFW